MDISCGARRTAPRRCVTIVLPALPGRYFLWSPMRVLFAFENSLPNAEADAEVFVTTAKYLAPYTAESWLHAPGVKTFSPQAVGRLAGMAIVQAWAPLGPAALRHFFCGLTIVLRREFRQ